MMIEKADDAVTRTVTWIVEIAPGAFRAAGTLAIALLLAVPVLIIALLFAIFLIVCGLLIAVLKVLAKAAKRRRWLAFERERLKAEEEETYP